MQNTLFFGHMDAAELMFYIFALFFLGLVIWLRREDRREGYPLETDVGGHLLNNDGLLQMATPKTFHLPFDQGSVTTPTKGRESIDVPNARRTAPWAGSPLEPTGSGIGAGVGPGAWAARSDTPDLTHEGQPRIVPIGGTGIVVEGRDPDPRGMKVLGVDGAVAGTVADLWVDRSEMMIRYLDVSVGDKSVLLPMTMALVDRRRGVVHCSALKGSQFAGAPGVAKAGIVTRLEEEKITAYFGSGYLYSSPGRSEPYL
ncbi:photosynthetic reaction center subunit H [Aquisediminimonas profunda]|uniref:photosynthetic reaction center subunit H n=1 Tax=Aquisediminimonas profunda TaxID=1550733 RepID=UPI001C6332B6|nr:photosynthetic reaction center subunit H [Aquisediminimonas profunda]